MVADVWENERGTLKERWGDIRNLRLIEVKGWPTTGKEQGELEAKQREDWAWGYHSQTRK